MASIHKNGNNYRLQFYDPTRTPNRKRVSLRVTNKKDALKIKALLESRYSQGLIDPWKKYLRAPCWGVGGPRIQQAQTLGEN